MDITGSVALVTGANRGLGAAFVTELRERGAAKVYATARDPRSIPAVDGVVPLQLDLLDRASVAEAARVAADVTLLINNAGISTQQNLLTGDLDAIRREMDTHFFGTLDVTRALAPILRDNGGGAIVNVLSALSWFSWNGATSYCAAKAAEWSLTSATRVELQAQHTEVVGVHLGAADTDMMKGYDGPLLSPADVVRSALDGLAAGRSEVLVDEWSRTVKNGLAADPATFYAEVARAQA